tara:strand:- start:102 stop:332 length:231 start_codon:yes stop_codon:yes gene_type:complete
MMRMIGIEKNAMNISIKSRKGSIADNDISQPKKIRQAIVEMNQNDVKNPFIEFLANIFPEHSGHTSQESEMGVPHL